MFLNVGGVTRNEASSSILSKVVERPRCRGHDSYQQNRERNCLMQVKIQTRLFKLQLKMTSPASSK